MLLYVFMESGFWQVQSQYLLEKYVKICPTPFAADSGFAAEGMRREPAELRFG